jgi:hypothetical protein
MRDFCLAVTIVAVAISTPLSGRLPDTRLQSAELEWDRGNYVAALDTYLQILDTQPAAPELEAIALQTGELYRTTELTTDGAAPRFSPDGRTLLYETGTGLTRVTRVVPTDGTTTAATEVPGFGAVFSPDGARLAYLAVTATPELTAAQASVDQGPPSDRPRRLVAFNELIAAQARIVVREMASGRESEIPAAGLQKTQLAYGAATLWFSGQAPGDEAIQIFEVAQGRPAVARTTGPLDKAIVRMNSTGTALLFTARPRAARGTTQAAPSQTFGLISTVDGHATTIAGASPAFSADGTSFGYVAREGNEIRLMAAATAAPDAGTAVRRGPEQIDAPAFSPEGGRLAFQMMSKDDWEIYTINRDGTGQTRVTREIQHDVLPVFLAPDRLLAAVGEPRHRRSYLYDLTSMTRTRLFHNNTVRTIAPEYSWLPSPDGSKVLITAERDGDTVSPQRGVYLVDLTRRVTRDELRARVLASLNSERALRSRGDRMYAPIAARVSAVTSQASIERIYRYEKTLFDFDSKFITQPGNARAAAFLYDTYASFGYAPQYQPFEYQVRNGPTGQTANVLATLKGTVNPELVYVVSSHFDSVVVGPGADDDSSGTAALLETARLLANQPQPATIIFASFTGEEAGLLGSREFVRRAVADKLRIVGALNNDMVGWANDFRLDDTIRYSNAGIRDVQHAAAMQFSNLITYDALYYKSTDAAAYYDAYGDIVGGIGSYPVLGNPHYHQPHDLLEGINHQLVTEVAKTTAATVMLLASSPSRVSDLKVTEYANGTAALSWAPSPEKDVTGYVVASGPASRPEMHMTRVARPFARLTGITAGSLVSVKAVNGKGLEGWDWARIVVQSAPTAHP